MDEIQFYSRIMKEHAIFLRLTLFERIEESWQSTENTDIRQI
ncbi:DUF2935 domain-containing protein [Jeotgalibacillus sp. S-D1]|nr:DUF2935 domain-containing protein [Jeotgalibacillus sp. S-D1]